MPPASSGAQGATEARSLVSESAVSSRQEQNHSFLRPEGEPKPASWCRGTAPLGRPQTGGIA